MTVKEVLDKLEVRIKKAKEAEDGDEFFFHLYYALSFQSLAKSMLSSEEYSDSMDGFGRLSAELVVLVMPSTEVG